MDNFAIVTWEGKTQTEIDELNWAIREQLDWFRGSIGSASCSVGFVIELAFHSVGRSYNVHAIRDEILGLEGRSKRTSATKKAQKFKGPLLSGLWYKHHFQPSFIAKNILQEINRPFNMERRLRRFMGAEVGSVLGELTSEIVDGSLSARSKRRGLTGEFIVFEKRQSGNFYLTLARHGEDERTRDRIDFYRTLDAEAAMFAETIGGNK